MSAGARKWQCIAAPVSPIRRPLINIQKPRRKSAMRGMDAMAAMYREGRWEARGCEAFSGNVGAGEFQRLGPARRGTFPGLRGRGFGDAKARNKMRAEHRQIVFPSRGASVCGRRDGAITKKIIGPATSIFRGRFNGRSAF